MKSRKSAGYICAIGIGLAGTFTIQTADARPGTKAFTCEQVKIYVQRRGAVVMNTTKSWVYRRFVADRRYCDRGETAVRYTVPTRSGSCRLRICKEVEFFRFKDRFRD